MVVDDLDRCSPECITQTLDAVRLVMSLDNVAVVIAIDDRVAFQAVAKHYEKLGDESRPGSAIARDYLGKIIQLPINLPQPGMPDLQGFIRGSLFNVTSRPRPLLVEDAAVASSAEPVGPNPPAPPGPLPEPGEEVDGASRPLASAVDAEKTARAATSQAFERSQKEMEDSHDERAWFEQLTQVLAFSNPRQLIRLKNSYRFLKGAYHRGEEAGDGGRSACRAMMSALFWSEYLYQMPSLDDHDPNRERRHVEVAMWHRLSASESATESASESDSKTPNGADTVVAMAEIFKEVLAEMGAAPAGYFELMNRVAMVVMPSAQGGVFLSEAALTGYVAGRAK